MATGRTRSCATCDANWRGRAVRFCGRCGAHLDEPTPGPRPAPSTDLRRRVAAVLGGVLAATALVTVGPSLPERELLRLDPNPAVVRLGTAPTNADEAAGADCQPTGDRLLGCGPTLTDARERVTAVVPRDGEVLVLRGTELEALELPEGRSRWRRPILDDRTAVRLHDAGQLVLAATSTHVQAIDAASGAQRWERPLPPLLSDGDPPLLWSDDAGVLVLGTEGWLGAFDLAKGTPRWSRDTVGTAAVATVAALVVSDGAAVRGWTADTDQPLWVQDRSDVEPRQQRPGRTVPGPVPLLANIGLIDPVDGSVIPLPGGGPARSDITADVTLLLHWPGGGDALDVSALDPGGQVRWHRTGLDLPCCLTTVVAGTPDRAALVAPGQAGVLLDLRTGQQLAVLDRDAGTLDSVVGDIALWRTSEGLVAEHVADGRARFRARGTVLSLSPLLLDGPDGLVAIDPAVVVSAGDARRQGQSTGTR